MFVREAFHVGFRKGPEQCRVSGKVSIVNLAQHPRIQVGCVVLGAE
jgi:hypothetical protein